MIIVPLSCIILILSLRRRERIMEIPVESEPTFVPFTCVFFVQEHRCVWVTSFHPCYNKLVLHSFIKHIINSWSQRCKTGSDWWGDWKCKGAFSKVGEVALVLLSCDSLSLCMHWR